MCSQFLLIRGSFKTKAVAAIGLKETHIKCNSLIKLYKGKQTFLLLSLIMSSIICYYCIMCINLIIGF